MQLLGWRTGSEDSGFSLSYQKICGAPEFYFQNIYYVLFLFRGRDCQLLFSYTLDPEAPEPCAVSSLVPLPSLQRVAVGLTNGRLFLVRSDILPTSSTMGEGSFVMTELGSSTVLHSLTAVFKDQGR